MFSLNSLFKIGQEYVHGFIQIKLKGGKKYHLVVTPFVRKISEVSDSKKTLAAPEAACHTGSLIAKL